MAVCKVCKTENEEEFTYCKNCGALLTKPKENKVESFYGTNSAVNQNTAPTYNQAPQYNTRPQSDIPDDLVAVHMMLPDVNNPAVRTMQKVYVTKAQLNAIKQAGMVK